jgi:hypothetical protein
MPERMEARERTDPRRAVADWLQEFNAALETRDSAAAASLFHTTSFWRDLVALTWNLVTVENPDGIRRMLEHTLSSARPRGFRVSEPPTEAADGVIQAWLEFETEAGRGVAHLRLRDGKAFTLLTTLRELKGHEEPSGRRRPTGAEHGVNPERQTWLEGRRREAEQLGYTTQPEVLVIGGGQGGIALGARLRQLDVPAMLLMREQPFMLATKALGYSDRRAILRHAVPNLMRAALIYSTLDMVVNLLLLASLAYLGLGAQPPNAELGSIIADGQNALLSAWWVATLPGLVVVLFGIGAGLLGDGLSDGRERGGAS